MTCASAVSDNPVFRAQNWTLELRITALMMGHPASEIISSMRKTYGVWALAMSLLLVGGTDLAMGGGSTDPAGQRVLNLGNRTLLILSLSSASSPSQAFTGSLSRPRHFQTSDSWSFSHIYGGIVSAPIVSSIWKDRAISITIQNPRDSADKDIFLF